MWDNIDNIRDSIAGFEPPLKDYRQPKPAKRQTKRARKQRACMQRLRDERRKAGLNAHGRIYGSPKPK